MGLTGSVMHMGCIVGRRRFRMGIRDWREDIFINGTEAELVEGEV